jgi:hypothetical protein
MVSAINFISDVSIPKDPEDTVSLDNPKMGLSVAIVAQQIISLLTSVDPARVKNISTSHLIELLENIQYTEQLRAAYLHEDNDATKMILMQIYAAKPSSFRNFMLTNCFHTAVADCDFEMMKFMIQEFPDLAKLDNYNALRAIESRISDGDEEGALWFLKNFAKDIDYANILTYQAENLEKMPRLKAELEAKDRESNRF